MSTLPPPVSELTARLGIRAEDLFVEDATRAGRALGDATALALAEVPAHVAAAWSTAAPQAVATIILKAARREYDNPEGVAQESMGGRSVGLSSTSGVYLTRREVHLIRRIATGRPSGYVGTVRIRSAYTAED